MKVRIFFGPPGSGKGTQAKLVIKEDPSWVHIAPGDILRANVKAGTELGKQAKRYMDEGVLVPDEIIVAMMAEELDKARKASKNVILDGFPRSVAQAESLIRMLEKSDDVRIIEFSVPDELIIERLSGRLVCPNCGAAYHIKNNPPQKNEICDRCGEKLIRRDDDKPEVISKRLEVYREETKKVLEVLLNHYPYTKLAADMSIEEIYKELKRFL